ncbi:uncharacterized protein LOC131856979 [Cryptomeria japonica]|uniref:uncharacterized protein LOC131856979 n=1 Tax=Cryptomeria japonica TaxID=3369 RepID=UPI0027DA3170|nr:uncharacterized protein LOC131856979 [Cryptomeria japonica]
MDPLLDENVDKNIGSSVMLKSGKEYLDILKEEGTPRYALILKPKNIPKVPSSSKEEVPKEVQQLLDRYKSIMVEEMPNTLPPIRDISHQFDFIPGSTLPNKPSYKMNPSQNEEIAKQVQELLDKGLVRKKINPYAIPMVPTPKKDGKDYLGHVISREGIAVDPSNIHAIVEYLAPINVGEVHSFMDLIGCYYQFVQGFLKISHPITSLQRKGRNSYVDGHVIAYESRKIKAHELNFPTHDLELVKVMHALGKENVVEYALSLRRHEVSVLTLNVDLRSRILSMLN